MFKSLKLKSKLLLSFFIITCLSTMATTIFSIYYFSNEIQTEALKNMQKNIQVADLIYNNKLQNLRKLTESLVENRTFQVLVQLYNEDKINQYIQAILSREQLDEIIVINSQKKVFGHVSNSKLSTNISTSMIAENILLERALTQKEIVSATELIKAGKTEFLSLSAAAPIIRSRTVRSGSEEHEEQQVIGIVLVRDILNNDSKLVQNIQDLLGVTAAIFLNRQAISFKNEPFIDIPQISSDFYQRLMTTENRQEVVDIRYNGQLAQYQTLFDMEKKPIAVLSVSVSANRYIESIRQAIITLIIIMLFCIIIASILGYLLAQSILVPIYQLLNGVKRVTSGDLSHEIIMDLRDELGILAVSFNSMAKQLQELFNTLEQRVQNATRRLQNTLAHMTAIIDNMADGLLVTDIEGKIIRYNPALSAMYPEQKNMIGKPCAEVFSEEIVDLARKSQLSTGEVYSAEIMMTNERIGKAVGTAIVLKDVLDEESAYVGSKRIGVVILVRDITREKEIDQMLKNTVDTLTRIGTALSAETNLRKLLDLFVAEARSLTGADAGSLYIVEKDYLQFEIVQNKSLDIFMGGSSRNPVSLPPIPLDSERFAARCARDKQIIRQSVSGKEGTIMRFKKDANSNVFSEYSVDDLLVVPMLDRMKNTVGVLQLLNPKDLKTGIPVNFSNNQIEIVSSLASQAAVAIDNVRNYEKIERKKVAFERFVPTEFLRRLGKQEVEDIKLGDASQESMSVLFADIRSFTNLSENMTAENNFHFLNDYLRFVGPNITRNGGFIDKYIGDAIMALFPGTNVSISDDAVAAAVGMMSKLYDFNQHLQRTRFQPISIGIGIHTGQLTLGTIGFESRMESTVIGDTVNMASRMEGLTKQYGICIGITSTTFQTLQQREQFLIREIDTVKVKGKEEALTVYEVFNADPLPMRDMKAHFLPRYHEGLELYKQQQWQAASILFSELRKHLIEDKVIHIYAERCQHFCENPPPSNWEGVTRLEEK